MTYETKLSTAIKLLSEIFEETPPTTYLSEIYNALVVLQDMYDAERKRNERLDASTRKHNDITVTRLTKNN